jgi:hypothetical protein
MQKICRAGGNAPEFSLAPIRPRPDCGCGTPRPDYLVDFTNLSDRQRAALPFTP